MKLRAKNLLGIAGVIGVVLGIIYAIPSYLQEKYLIATLATILIVGGLILLAIAFGDWFGNEKGFK